MSLVGTYKILEQYSSHSVVPYIPEKIYICKCKVFPNWVFRNT